MRRIEGQDICRRRIEGQDICRGDPTTTNNTRKFYPREAKILAGQSQSLMSKPFFDPPPAGKTHGELLAEAFPARTNPAGRNPVSIFNDQPIGQQYNFDMVGMKNGWITEARNAGLTGRGH